MCLLKCQKHQCFSVLAGQIMLPVRLFLSLSWNRTFSGQRVALRANPNFAGRYWGSRSVVGRLVQRQRDAGSHLPDIDITHMGVWVSGTPACQTGCVCVYVGGDEGVTELRTGSQR